MVDENERVGRVGEYFARARKLTEVSEGNLAADIEGLKERGETGYTRSCLLEAIHEAMQANRELTFDRVIGVLRETFPDRRYSGRREIGKAINQAGTAGGSVAFRLNEPRMGVDLVVPRVLGSAISDRSCVIDQISRVHTEFASAIDAPHFDLSENEREVLNYLLFQYWGVDLQEMISVLDLTEDEVMGAIDSINTKAPKLEDHASTSQYGRPHFSDYSRIHVNNGVVVLTSGSVTVPFPDPEAVRNRISVLLRELGVLSDNYEDMTGEKDVVID